MKRHYKKRGKIRSAWETYSETYDKLAKRNPSAFQQKYTKKEFELEYQRAKALGEKNPAREVARRQRIWNYNLSRKYKKLTGKEIEGATAEEKSQAFTSFADEFFGGNYKEAEDYLY